MSLATVMNHPGLVFATLVVQLVTANGSPVLAVAPRGDFLINLSQISPRRGGNDCTENHDCSTSATPPPQTSSAHVTTSASQNNTSQTTSPAVSTSSMPSSSTATSSTSTPTPTPQLSAQSHSRMSITTGGIIGVAFGAFVMVVITLILCGTYYRRSRTSRSYPQEKSQPPQYQDGLPPAFEDQFAAREMSQTQSSPLVASAVASRMTSTPPLHYPHSTTTSSLSPLIPAASLDHARSFTSSSNRRTSLSYTDGSSSHEPLHPTQEMQNPASSWPLGEHAGALRSGLAGGLAGIILGSTTTAPPPPEPSNLVRAMTAYQKSLEADDQKSSQSGSSTSASSTKQEEQDITDSHDPPPRYDA